MTKRIGIVAGVVSAFLLASMTAAFAAADSTAVSTVSDGAATLKDTLVSIASSVLPYAAAILAITFGWRLAKKFVHG